MATEHLNRKWKLKLNIQSELNFCKIETKFFSINGTFQKYNFHFKISIFRFFEIFEKYDGYKHGHIKLKRPKQLQEILDIARFLLSEIQLKSADNEIEEKQGKLEQLKSVLEM